MSSLVSKNRKVTKTKKITIELELEYDPQNVIFMFGGDLIEDKGKKSEKKYPISATGKEFALSAEYDENGRPSRQGHVQVNMSKVWDELKAFMEEVGEKSKYE